jgi:putative hydrolase of the HAD superfamily
MIETVVVDLGGVAARYLPLRRLDALATLSGLTPDEIQSRLYDSGFDAEAEAGRYQPDALFSEIHRRLGMKKRQDAALVQAWSTAFEPDFSVLRVLGRLPVEKALFTNNGPMIDACLAGPLKSLAAFLNRNLISSWQLGARKPEAASFEKAAQRLGKSPAALLLLDDSAANVDAALRCGWDAERVTDAAEVLAALERRPDLAPLL